MTKQDAEQLVRQHFPNVTSTVSEFITSGWDNDVLVVDNTLVFRIPRVESERSLLLGEIALLAALHERGIQNIPHYQYVTADGTLGGYQKLIGKNATPEYIASLSKKEKEAFGIAYGLFLKQLHATPISLVKEHVQTYNLYSDIEKLEEDIISLREYFPGNHYYTAAQEILGQIKTMLKQDRSTVLVHRDMNPGNVLWEVGTGTLSVIDFTDRSIAHPAIDMAYLMGYDSIIRDAAFHSYGSIPATWKDLAHNVYKSIGLRVLRAACKGSKNITMKEAQQDIIQKFSL